LWALCLNNQKKNISKPGGFDLSQRDLDWDSLSWHFQKVILTVEIFSTLWKTTFQHIEKRHLKSLKNDISTLWKTTSQIFEKRHLNTLKNDISTLWKTTSQHFEKRHLNTLKDDISTLWKTTSRHVEKFWSPSRLLRPLGLSLSLYK